MFNDRTRTLQRRGGPAVSGIVDGIDFDARYSMFGMPGVAFWLHGWDQETIPERYELECIDPDSHCEDCHEPACWIYSEPEQADRPGYVRAVMVGDDYEHVVDVTDLTVITEEDYCNGCGQIGCRAYG